MPELLQHTLPPRTRAGPPLLIKVVVPSVTSWPDPAISGEPELCSKEAFPWMVSVCAPSRMSAAPKSLRPLALVFPPSVKVDPPLKLRLPARVSAPAKVRFVPLL